MPTTTIQNGKAAAFKLAHLTAKAAGGKMLAEDLVEIGRRKAQRIVRKGYEAGEDYLDESKRYIRHNPWRSVGVALGVGLAWIRERASQPASLSYDCRDHHQMVHSGSESLA